MKESIPESFVYAYCPYCRERVEAEIFAADIVSANAIVKLKIAVHEAGCPKRPKNNKEEQTTVAAGDLKESPKQPMA